jgi:aminoglycoside 3-N-acetyltransferase
VEVHISLSSLGYVVGGAGTVIMALLSVVGEEGAIIMSAYPVTPAIP